MCANLESAILDALYSHFESHPGFTKMTPRELYGAIGVSPEDSTKVGEVRRKLFSLKKSKWVEYQILEDGSSGTIEITFEGIRVAEGRRQPPPVPPKSEAQPSEQRKVRETTGEVDILEQCPPTLEDLVQRNQTCAYLVQRDDVLDEIKGCFTRTAGRQHFIVLHGQPMVGKTRIFERLAEALGDSYAPMIVTGQGLGLEALGKLDTFAFDLAIQLTNKFTKWARLHRVSQSLSNPTWNDFRGGRGRRAFYTYWDNLRRTAGGRKPIVMFDEIEHLLDYPSNLNPRILTFLDDFLHNPENGYFIVAGSERIQHAENERFSRLIARGYTIRVRYYDHETILSVFSMLQDYFLFDRDVLDCLVAHCDGHPRLLPAVYRATRSLGKRELDKDDIEPVLDEVIDQTDDALWVLLTRLSPDERAVVQLISQNMSAATVELEYSLDDLAKLAGQLSSGPRADYESLSRGITHLERRQWIEWKNRAEGQFRFKLGILPWWAHRHHVSFDEVRP